MKRFVLLALPLLLLPGCKTPLPAPTPCSSAGGAPQPTPAWPPASAWTDRELEQPLGGWIGSLAFAPDGRSLVYVDAPEGDFIPTSNSVSAITFNLTTTAAPRDLIDLPGDALRNQAAFAWSAHGLAWASWTAIGVDADPPLGAVRVLYTRPKPHQDSLPTFSSIAWSPNGGCVAATLTDVDHSQLVAWNAGGARDASHRVDVTSFETADDWGADGVLLVSHEPDKAPTARRLEPATGAFKPAEAPPRDVAASFLAGRWLTVDKLGVVRWGTQQIGTVKSALDARGLKQEHAFLRVFGAPNGRAIAVEEGVTGPSVRLRHVHLLTVGAP